MFDFNYLVEILTPKRGDGNLAGNALNLFAERYYRVIDHGLGISVPDNPMGQPRYSLLQTIAQAGLPVISHRTVMNLNTFHTKEELDELLLKAARMAIKYLLVVRGDGGPNLPKLSPKSIGGLYHLGDNPVFHVKPSDRINIPARVIGLINCGHEYL